MSTNRRIYEESANLVQRENCFICLTFSRPSRLARFLSRDGIKMIASGAKAHRFLYAAMTLTVDSPIPADSLVYQSNDPADKQPSKYVFCVDELPTFCRRLLKGLGKHNKGENLRETTIHIDIRNNWRNQSWEMDRSASGVLRLHKLLDPLRQLHSLRAVQIEGPLSASYKRNVIADLGKESPTAMDLIGTAIMMLDQGDQHIRQDCLIDAINIYKTALNCVRSCCWIYDERDFLLDSGPFPGLTAEQTMRNMKVRLLARIASTYFQKGMLRMARIYTERALKREHSPYFQDRTLYQVDRRPWQQVVYTEVLHVSAQIFYAYGYVSKALKDLRKAQEYAELNVEQLCTLQAWEMHRDRLSERRTNTFRASLNHFQKKGLNTVGMRTWSAFVGFRL